MKENLGEKEKMALRKRKPSQKIQKAEKRFNAMEDIDEKSGRIVNYGGEQNPLTKTEMGKHIELIKQMIEEYNEILIEADRKSNEIRNAEEELGEMYTRVLAGGVSIFGVDSNEIEELGGTRKSDRKNSNKEKKQE